MSVCEEPEGFFFKVATVGRAVGLESTTGQAGSWARRNETFPATRSRRTRPASPFRFMGRAACPEPAEWEPGAQPSSAPCSVLTPDFALVKGKRTRAAAPPRAGMLPGKPGKEEKML